MDYASLYRVIRWSSVPRVNASRMPIHTRTAVEPDVRAPILSLGGFVIVAIDPFARFSQAPGHTDAAMTRNWLPA